MSLVYTVMNLWVQPGTRNFLRSWATKIFKNRSAPWNWLVGWLVALFIDDLYAE